MQGEIVWRPHCCKIRRIVVHIIRKATFKRLGGGVGGGDRVSVKWWCLRDKGSRALASHRGRANLIEVIVEERMLRTPPCPPRLTAAFNT